MTSGPKQRPHPPETNPLEYLPVILNRCFPGFSEHTAQPTTSTAFSRQSWPNNPGQVVNGEDDTEQYTCRWACNLTHKGHRLHAVMCEVKAKKDGKETRFVFLTDHRPDAERVHKMINMGGRQRGKIENQGFNVQKNCGYELEKAYGFRDQALKNYYLLVQIAHCLHQLMMHTDVNAKLMQEEDQRKFPAAKTGLQAFKSLKALAKAIGEYLRHGWIGRHVLDRHFARGLQLRFVFDTS